MIPAGNKVYASRPRLCPPPELLLDSGQGLAMNLSGGLPPQAISIANLATLPLLSSLTFAGHSHTTPPSTPLSSATPNPNVCAPQKQHNPAFLRPPHARCEPPQCLVVPPTMQRGSVPAQLRACRLCSAGGAARWPPPRPLPLVPLSPPPAPTQFAAAAPRCSPRRAAR